MFASIILALISPCLAAGTPSVYYLDEVPTLCDASTRTLSVAGVIYNVSNTMLATSPFACVGDVSRAVATAFEGPLGLIMPRTGSYAYRIDGCTPEEQHRLTSQVAQLAETPRLGVVALDLRTGVDFDLKLYATKTRPGAFTDKYTLRLDVLYEDAPARELLIRELQATRAAPPPTMAQDYLAGAIAPPESRQHTHTVVEGHEVDEEGYLNRDTTIAVQIVNARDETVAIYFVDEVAESEVVMNEGVQPEGTFSVSSYQGHLFRAKSTATGAAVADVRVPRMKPPTTTITLAVA